MSELEAQLAALAGGSDLIGFLVGLAAIAVAVMVAIAVHGLATRLLRRLAARRSPDLADVALGSLASPSRLLLVAFAVLAATPSLPLGEDAGIAIRRIVGLLLIAALGWLLVGVARVGKSIVDARFDVGVADNLRARQVRTRTGILYRIVIALVVVLTGCLMLMSFPSVRHVGLTLFASAGLAGLAIGAAAQPALKNLIAGFQLAFTEPIRLDDVVIVDDEWGRIEEIRLTYVVVRIWDERRLIVPVSRFLEAPFQNWTRRTADILGTALFYLDYTVPVERVRAKLKEIAEGSPHWDGKTCVLQVTDLKEHTIELRALVSAANAGDAFDLRCEVREKMIAFIRDKYPHALPRLRTQLGSDGATLRLAREAA